MLNKVSDSYKHHISGFIIGPVLKIIEAIFDLLMPLIMKAIIDLNQYNEPSNIPNALSRSLAYFIRIFNSSNSSINDALVGGGIILVMGIVGFVITMSAQYIAAATSVNVGTEIRNALFYKILHLSKKNREEITDGKLLTVINSDTYQHQYGVLLFVRLIVRAPFILLGSLIFSLILDYRVGLAFVAIVPLIVLVNALILKKSANQYIEIQKDLDNLSSKTSEVASGARLIRASNNQEDENKAFNNLTTKYQDKAIKVNKINALINPLTFAITSIVIIIIIYLLKDNLLSGDEKVNMLTISTIIAEMSYLAQIFFVTVQLTQTAIDLVKANVASKRINSVLSIKEEIVNSVNPKTSEISEQYPVIKFDKVYFSFDKDNNYFFSSLDFEIRKNETFAIIGGTGSGKSVIANLIERFYEVDKGEIRYNNISLKEYDLSSLRKDIALVNQKPSLFKGSIKSNFLLANPNASDEEINYALEMADALEFVNKYEDKLDHEVIEGGKNFSGGQRQRLSIAIALIKKPKLLILDDSTSSLDLLTDKKIRNNINTIKDMTKVIISQRISSINHADYILVLEGGRVVGLGKHEELLKDCSLYQEIYHSQIKKGE